MGLDAVDKNDAVRPPGMTIHEHPAAKVAGCQLDNLHRGKYRGRRFFLRKCLPRQVPGPVHPPCAPPWLPMAGTINGAAPASRITAAAVFTIRSIPTMPLLPVARAILHPARNRKHGIAPADSVLTRPGFSDVRVRFGGPIRENPRPFFCPVLSGHGDGFFSSWQSATLADKNT